jgi:hypothetical protein
VFNHGGDFLEKKGKTQEHFKQNTDKDINLIQ